ncbi:MAG: amidohydrolase family protein [Candidatus Rokubacteria bacterium]|nr:amidohydrolase family protein [Candidatus Rokubacteria bacterium]
MIRFTRLAVAVLAAVAIASPAAAADRPIFDAHIHYSQGDWSSVPPERALAILKEAGVRRALVSSTPDDGTLKLYEKAPDVIVPMLRPYRTRADMGSWTRDTAVQAYVEERLKRGVHRGIGEFHMSAGDADAPVVRRFAELSAERGLMLHAHVDEAAIERLATLYPKARFLWAHAGFAGAEVVGRIVDRFPNVWVELALNSSVTSGGRLDPAWARLFARKPDRFLVGTDTWVTSRWESVVPGHRDYRAWLAELPADVADQIAWKNGETLFGSR